jgi:hypothetical protein
VPVNTLNLLAIHSSLVASQGVPSIDLRDMKVAEGLKPKLVLMIDVPCVEKIFG